MAFESWNTANPLDKNTIPSLGQENILLKEDTKKWTEFSNKEDEWKAKVELLEDIRMWKVNEIKTKLTNNPSLILRILNNLPNYKISPEIHKIIVEALSRVEAGELALQLQNTTSDISGFLPEYFNILVGDSGKELAWQVRGQIDKSQLEAPQVLQDQVKIDATKTRWVVQEVTSQTDTLRIDFAEQPKIARSILQAEWVDISKFIV